MDYDELKVYRGRDIPITKKIIVTQPTLDQIEEFGEKKYFSAVYNLTSVGADLKWQLWDMKIDYTKINDYDLFIRLISQIVSSKKKLYRELTEHPDKYQKELANLTQEDLDDMLINPLELVLNGIDLADFTPHKLNKNDQIVLYNSKDDIIIDRAVYFQMVDAIRKIHGFKRNNETPANERTKMDLIEDARDEAMIKKPYKSVILPLVSTLSVLCGQCGDDRIWNMPIGRFFYDIKRSNKIQDAQSLLKAAYSGFANLKGIDKSRFDMFGDI